jgi:hypothetical protein
MTNRKSKINAVPSLNCQVAKLYRLRYSRVMYACYSDEKRRKRTRVRNVVRAVLVLAMKISSRLKFVLLQHSCSSICHVYVNTSSIIWVLFAFAH